VQNLEKLVSPQQFVHMQDPSDLLTGSANGYVAGQIISDAFLVRKLFAHPVLDFDIDCPASIGRYGFA
jgi:hypothetical protein